MTKNNLKNTNLVSYLCMILGVVALFTQVDKKTTESQYITIAGLSLLIIGIYGIAKKLPSKREEDYKEPLVRTKNENHK